MNPIVVDTEHKMHPGCSFSMPELRLCDSRQEITGRVYKSMINLTKGVENLNEAVAVVLTSSTDLLKKASSASDKNKIPRLRTFSEPIKDSLSNILGDLLIAIPNNPKSPFQKSFSDVNLTPKAIRRNLRIQANVIIEQHSAKLMPDIQKMFPDDNIINQNRFLVREDEVSIRLSQSILLLFNDMLIIYRKDWRNTSHVIAKASLQDVRVFDITESDSQTPSDTVFEIELIPSDDFSTRCRYLISAIDKKGWLDAYKNLVNIDRIRTKTYEEVTKTSTSTMDYGHDDERSQLHGTIDSRSLRKRSSSTNGIPELLLQDMAVAINQLVEMGQEKQSVIHFKNYEIEGLKSKISEISGSYKMDIEIFQNESSRLQNIITDMAKKAQELNEIKVDLDSKVDSLNLKNQEISNQVLKITDENSLLKKDFSAKNEELIAASENLKKTNLHKDEIQRIVALKDAKLAETSEVIKCELALKNALNEKLLSYEVKICTQKEAIETASSDCTLKYYQIVKLESSLEEHRKCVIERDSELQQKESKLQSCESEINSLNESILILETKLKHEHHGTNEIKQKTNNLQSENDELGQSLNAKIIELEKSHGISASQKQNIENMLEHQNQLETKISTLSNQLINTDSQIAADKLRLIELQSKNYRLVSEISELEMQISAHLNTINEAQAKINLTSNVLIKKTERQLNDCILERAELQKQMTLNENEMTEQLETIDLLKAENSKMFNEIIQSKSVNDMLNQNMSHKTTNLLHTEQELNALRAKLLEKELNDNNTIRTNQQNDAQTKHLEFELSRMTNKEIEARILVEQLELQIDLLMKKLSTADGEIESRSDLIAVIKMEADINLRKISEGDEDLNTLHEKNALQATEIKNYVSTISALELRIATLSNEFSSQQESNKESMHDSEKNHTIEIRMIEDQLRLTMDIEIKKEMLEKKSLELNIFELKSSYELLENQMKDKMSCISEMDVAIAGSKEALENSRSQYRNLLKVKDVLDLRLDQLTNILSISETQILDKEIQLAVARKEKSELEQRLGKYGDVSSLNEKMKSEHEILYERYCIDLEVMKEAVYHLMKNIVSLLNIIRELSIASKQDIPYKTDQVSKMVRLVKADSLTSDISHIPLFDQKAMIEITNVIIHKLKSADLALPEMVKLKLEIKEYKELQQMTEKELHTAAFSLESIQKKFQDSDNIRESDLKAMKVRCQDLERFSQVWVNENVILQKKLDVSHRNILELENVNSTISDELGFQLSKAESHKKISEEANRNFEVQVVTQSQMEIEHTNQIEKLQKIILEFKSQLDLLQGEKKRLTNQLKHSIENSQTANGQLEAANKNCKLFATELDRMRQELLAKRDDANQIQNDGKNTIVQMKLQQNRQQAELKHLKEDLEKSNHSINGLMGQLKVYEIQTATFKQKGAEAEDRDRGQKVAMKKLVNEVGKFQSQVLELEIVNSNLHNEILHLDCKLRSQGDNFSAIQNEISFKSGLIRSSKGEHNQTKLKFQGIPGAFSINNFSPMLTLQIQPQIMKYEHSKNNERKFLGNRIPDPSIIDDYPSDRIPRSSPAINQVQECNTKSVNKLEAESKSNSFALFMNAMNQW